jgi:hypothetical protein
MHFQGNTPAPARQDFPRKNFQAATIRLPYSPTVLWDAPPEPSESPILGRPEPFSPSKWFPIGKSLRPDRSSGSAPC